MIIYINAASERGMRVCKSPRVLADGGGDLARALLLALARLTAGADKLALAGYFSAFAATMIPCEDFGGA